jgi:hypothetical protein
MTMSRNVIRRVTCAIACGFTVALAWPQQAAGEMKIVVIEGDGGANILKGKVAVKPVVEVRDQWNIPIAGAQVTFDPPSGKPGVTFVSGKKDESVVTDINGRATTGALKPIGKGQFKIRIRASYHGDAASTTIMQTNYGTAESARGAVRIPGPYANAMTGATKTLVVVGVVAAAAAVGAAAALGSKSGSNCTSQYNQLVSDNSVAANTPITSPQWFPNEQTEMNALGAYCSCAGGLGQLSSALQQDFLALIADARQLPLSVPTNCGN